jgi:hypothetical protein
MTTKNMTKTQLLEENSKLRKALIALEDQIKGVKKKSEKGNLPFRLPVTFLTESNEFKSVYVQFNPNTGDAVAEPDTIQDIAANNKDFAIAMHFSKQNMVEYLNTLSDKFLQNR